MEKQHNNDTIGQGATTAKPSKATSQAADFVKQSADRTGAMASDVADTISEAASDFGDTVAQNAERTQNEALKKVAEGTERTVNKGKSFTQDILLSLSRAFEAGSRSLESDGMASTASYARATGKGLETAADEVDGLDSANVAHRVETFVRERPFQTVGLFALAGFTIATVMKASMRKSND